jgi:hypothetical protein
MKSLMDPADTFSQRFSPAEMDTQETKEISTKQERRLEELRLEKLKVRLALLLGASPPAGIDHNAASQAPLQSPSRIELS